MTSDQNEEEQKNTWWDIHKCDKQIACLDRKILREIDAMRDTLKHFDGKTLTANQGHLCWRSAADEIPSYHTLDRNPNVTVLVESLEEREEVTAKRDELQKIFDRM